MRHGERILVAATAAVAIAFSSMAAAVLWHLWRHPIRWNVEPWSGGIVCRFGEWTAEIDAPEGRVEQIIVWR